MLIGGIRRSGNHLLMQQIVCNNPDNSVLLVNDFPSLRGRHERAAQFAKFKESSVVKAHLISIATNKHSTFSCEEKDLKLHRGSESTADNDVVSVTEGRAPRQPLWCPDCSSKSDARAAKNANHFTRGSRVG